MTCLNYNIVQIESFVILLHLLLRHRVYQIHLRAFLFRRNILHLRGQFSQLRHRFSLFFCCFLALWLRLCHFHFCLLLSCCGLDWFFCSFLGRSLFSNSVLVIFVRVVFLSIFKLFDFFPEEAEVVELLTQFLVIVLFEKLHILLSCSLNNFFTRWQQSLLPAAKKYLLVTETNPSLFLQRTHRKGEFLFWWLEWFLLELRLRSSSEYPVIVCHFFYGYNSDWFNSQLTRSNVFNCAKFGLFLRHTIIHLFLFRLSSLSPVALSLLVQ